MWTWRQSSPPCALADPPDGRTLRTGGPSRRADPPDQTGGPSRRADLPARLREHSRTAGGDVHLLLQECLRLPPTYLNSPCGAYPQRPLGYLLESRAAATVPSLQ